MRKNIKCLCAFLMIPFVLSSCQLMPEEEVLPAIPVIASYEGAEYKMATVERGDLVLNKTISCVYVPAREESLSFSLGGLYIDNVYVQEGDAVYAGQLLAELEQDNIQDQISSQEYQLDVLYMNREHLLENLSLDLRKQDIVLEDLYYQRERAEGYRNEMLIQQIEKQELKRKEVELQYAEQMQGIDDSIYIKELQLEELKKTLRERQIFANFDGIITYIRETKEGERSVEDQVLCTVSDLATTVFVVEGENAVLFAVDEQVILTCDKKEYVAYVVDPAELGISYDAEKPKAYLRLSQPDPTLEDGDKGRIDMILEEHKDVLYVPAKAVRTADGQAFVYVLDENGLRTMKEVSVGFQSGDNMEILNGLAEGDKVIVE